jgi:hypothetical protein
MLLYTPKRRKILTYDAANQAAETWEKIFLNFVSFYDENLCERGGLIIDKLATWLNGIQTDSPYVKTNSCVWCGLWRVDGLSAPCRSGRQRCDFCYFISPLVGVHAFRFSMFVNIRFLFTILKKVPEMSFFGSHPRVTPNKTLLIALHSFVGQF